MRVIFDHLPIVGSSPTGPARWTLGAVQSLSREAPDWAIHGLGASLKKSVFAPSKVGPNVRFTQLPIPDYAFRLLQTTGAAPAAERFVGDFDASLGSRYIPFRSKKGAEIPVVYGFVWVRFPETVPKTRLYYLNYVLPKAIKRASVLVTISQSVKDEIVDMYDVDPDRIAIVSPGPQHGLGSVKSTSPRVPQLPKEFMLFVGTLEPKKNISGLIEAYGRLRTRRPDFPPLVCAGGLGWRTENFREALEAQVRAGNVVLLGYVDESVVDMLYEKALAFVFPSLYEGFGMPVLEAMGAGCPVLTSNCWSLPEVAGGAALLVDPANTDEIESGLETLADDGALRLKMRDAGLKRAAHYSWEATGRALKSAIEKGVELKNS